MKHLQLMIKPSSSNCNLNCCYCFYKDECSNRNTYSYGFMKEETLEILVQKALHAAELSCGFGFQGGEPTLIGLNFYKKFVELVKKYKKSSTNVTFSIQTNGTLLTEEWAEFFSKNRFLVGISLDGTREIHDRNRKDAGGKDTFKKVLENARMLQNHHVDVNILCVLTKQSAKKVSSIYQFLKKEGFYFQQYIPCLDPLEEERGGYPWSLTPSVYGAALKDLFDLWFQDLSSNTPVSIREFDNWLAILKGYPPEACSQVGRCSIQNIVEANGDLFPCDFYALDSYRIGNVSDDSFSFNEIFSQDNIFLKEGSVRGKECPSCNWYPLCRGGCRRDYMHGHNYFCESYKDFFSYTIERMKWLAARL